MLAGWLLSTPSARAEDVKAGDLVITQAIMTMRPLEKGLTIEPGKTVKLSPGGYHLMLTDLRGPLRAGDKLPIMLEFEKAGKVHVSLEVQAVGAQGPAGASGGAMEMHKMAPEKKM